MSRIGKKPIVIPKGVKVDAQPGAVEIQGPKGKLRQPLPTGIGFEVDGSNAPSFRVGIYASGAHTSTQYCKVHDILRDPTAFAAAKTRVLPR